MGEKHRRDKDNGDKNRKRGKWAGGGRKDSGKTDTIPRGVPGVFGAFVFLAFGTL